MSIVAPTSRTDTAIRFGPAWSKLHHGLGEFEEPHEWSESRARACTLFFDTIRIYVPEVIANLHSLVFPVFADAWEAGAETATLERYDETIVCHSAKWEKALWWWDYLNGLADYGDDTIAPWEVPNELLRLREQLWTWCARWGLFESWCLDKALLMLRLWLQIPNEEEFIADTWSTFTARPSSSQPQRRIVFGCTNWNPLTETRAKGRQRMLAEIEQELDEHLDFTELLARASGQRRTPRKSADHFVWLVQYQVQQHSFTRIADAVCRDRKTVERAIKDAAVLVGVSLRRPSKGGRPRKTAA